MAKKSYIVRLDTVKDAHTIEMIERLNEGGRMTYQDILRLAIQTLYTGYECQEGHFKKVLEIVNRVFDAGMQDLSD